MESKQPNIRPLKSQSQVLAEVAEKLPHLSQHLYIERDWIWYAGPSLKEMKADREVLKEIGFAFKFNGTHPLSNGMQGTWSHSCMKPMPRGKGKGKRGKQDSHKGDTNEKEGGDDADLVALVNASL